MASKKYAKVEKDFCVACGSCELVCPKKAIEVYRGCYAKVNEGECVGCGRCSRVCPAGCIELKERGIS